MTVVCDFEWKEHLQRLLNDEILVCKDVFRSVSQLFQIWQTGILDHRRRAAEDDEDIVGCSGEVVLDHVIGHKSWAVAPVWRIRSRTTKLNFHQYMHNSGRVFSTGLLKCESVSVVHDVVGFIVPNSHKKKQYSRSIYGLFNIEACLLFCFLLLL